MTKKYSFTSESVSEGHPDKIADQISDAILDAHLDNDAHSRIAIETLVKNNDVVLAGEITSNAQVDYSKIVRDTIKQIGYTEKELGFDDKTCNITELISAQSNDISVGVNEKDGKYSEQGAGDQGLMFGFACNETESLMPMPIDLSHKLVNNLSQKRKNGASFLKPDAKSQVTVEYLNGVPNKVTDIVISTQHEKDFDQKKLEEFIIEEVIKTTIPKELLSKDCRYLINPTGVFVIGGPVGDCGLTGRKIIVDTYGGYGRHGGGAFSGKDPSKVDRSGAYIARYVAKNIVKSNVADKCEIQISYAIGYSKPVSVYVNTFNTGKISDNEITDIINKNIDLTPKGIVTTLNLLKPIYQATASYGHFGRTPTDKGEFSWEKTNLTGLFN